MEEKPAWSLGLVLVEPVGSSALRNVDSVEETLAVLRLKEFHPVIACQRGGA